MAFIITYSGRGGARLIDSSKQKLNAIHFIERVGYEL